LKKARLLILCTHNAARSPMAEAYLRRYAGDHFEVHSAGLDPRQIHPYTTRVMAEAGLSLDGHQARGVETYLGKVHFGYMITVCNHAEQNCPSAFMGISQRYFWDLEDPTKFEGSDEARLAKFRQVRDEIDGRIRGWLADREVADAGS
jgi:arsenate reductase